jgi:hypothetical protein
MTTGAPGGNGLSDGVLRAWGLDPRLCTTSELRTGHIHRSYRVERDGTGGLLLQRLNHHVFLHPTEVMENVSLVTRHILRRRRERGDDEIERRSLELVPTALGREYHRDLDGFVWRAFRWIGGAEIHEVAGPAHAESAAAAYGEFQLLLADLPPERLHFTIPRFHDTAHRFDQLEEAAAADRAGRRAAAVHELEALRARREVALRLAAVPLPVRVVHNDTKLSNVLFEQGTSRALCVVDLDTVMPGLCAHDFGDMVRSVASTAPEDSPGGAGAAIDPGAFSALARGYLRATADWLTGPERGTLVDGAFAIVAEMASRFLTDHLNGDVYFRTSRADHNLDRARTQLALFESLVEQEDELRRIVAGCVAGA